jgi:hypothetical protein
MTIDLNRMGEVLGTAVPRRGEEREDYIKRVGIKVANKYLGGMLGSAVGSSVYEATGDSGYAGASSGAARGLLGGLGRYARDGDLGEALKSGGLGAARGAASGYVGGKYGSTAGSTVAGVGSAASALLQGASGEEALKAGLKGGVTSAVSNWNPYAGAALGAADLLFNSEDMTKNQKLTAGADIGVSAIASSAPAVGAYYGAFKLAQGITANVQMNKSKNQRLYLGVDADTGKGSLRVGGKMTQDDLKKIRPEALNKLSGILFAKSRNQQGLRDQYLATLSPEDLEYAKARPQGSQAEIEISQQDINRFNTDEWINSNNQDDYLTGKHSKMWSTGKMDNLKDYATKYKLPIEMGRTKSNKERALKG